MKKLIFTFIIYHLTFIVGKAQELNCNISINADAIFTQQTTDKQIYVDMKAAMSDFINTKRWTNDIFSPDERIKCNLIITLTKSPQQNVFQGTSQFQVARPIYGTTAETVVLNYIDRNFSFSFTPEDRTMIFSEQTYSNNLTSILAFYANLALGVDYDSFGKLGGNPYFQKAFNIANLAANASQSGWQSSEDQRNRYWLIENFQSLQLQAFREGMYAYHRLALDNFTTDPATGRKQIMDLLMKIKEIQAIKSSSAVMWYSFFDAKDKELVNVFSEAPKNEKQKAFNLLAELDPAKTEFYRKLMK
jgi:Domain of unknown function (DUF4835)